VLPGQTFKLEDIGRILLRYRWLILLPFAVGLAVAPFIASRIPEIYKSETLIMVIPQRVPDTYVKSTVTASVEDRLPSISDQIMSRVRLESVINDFGLYPEMRARAPMEDVVLRMRGDIGSPRIQKGAQSFRIGYQSEDPNTAQKVTARLATLFIDENSRDRENLAQSTNVFLESELEDAKRRLLEHEKKLEEYRRLHSGELPSQVESNLQAISTAQLQLQSVSESLNRARERRLLLERQLVEAQTSPAETQSSVIVAAGGGETQVAATSSQQLEIAQRNLDVLRLRLTSDHPDVRKFERTVAELKIRIADEARRPKPAPAEKVLTTAEQSLLKKIRELQADLEVIDHQLSVNSTEEARLRSVIATYQQKVETSPKRESELVELTRDYEILKKTYDSLLTKREDSKLAANLERRQIGEQFRILDPAPLPVRPSNQVQRLALSFSGALLGLALGLLLTALLEFRDSSFAREGEVARLLDLPVLALVPVMISESEQRTQRRRSVLLDVAASAVFVAATVILVVWGLPRF
jgi:polysaccharide chain length determinant protein (PEP-CTERM system associated)